jgi:hypothetical protein
LDSVILLQRPSISSMLHIVLMFCVEQSGAEGSRSGHNTRSTAMTLQLPTKIVCITVHHSFRPHNSFDAARKK